MNVASITTVSSVGRLAMLFTAHATGTASITVVLVMAPAIEPALHLGHAGFGFMVSAYYSATLVLALPGGWLVDRFGLRRMLILASILMSLGLWLFSRAPNAWLGALALGLCGAGYALVNPATARAVLQWFAKGSRATAMSIKQTGVPAGGVLAALVAASGLVDWRDLALAIAAFTLLVSLGYAALPATHLRAANASWWNVGALFRRPRLAFFNVGACLYATCQGAFFAYLVLYARDALAAPVTVASACLAGAHIASGAGRICWGVASDRFARLNRTVILALLGLLAAAAVVLLLSLPSLGGPALLTAAAAMIGFTLGGYAGLVQAAAVEAVDIDSVGAAIGYNMLLVSLGTVIGPAAFGVGVQSLGYTVAWSAMAAVLVVGAALFRISRPMLSWPH